MGSQYAGSDVYPSDFAIPDDGDPSNAATVNVAFEALGDRTTYLLARGEVLPNLAALKAIPAPTGDMKKYVRDFGWYAYSPTAPITGLYPFWIKADDLTPGAWVSGTAHETSKKVWIPGAAVTGARETAGAITMSTTTKPLSDQFTYNGDGIFILVQSTSSTLAFAFLWSISREVINGAKLASVTMVYNSGGSTPEVFPQICVFRAPRTSYNPIREALSSVSDFILDDGIAYDDSAVARELVYTTDQNNVIDTSLYGYGILLFDEHGTGAVGAKSIHGFVLDFVDIPDARRA